MLPRAPASILRPERHDHGIDRPDCAFFRPRIGAKKGANLLALLASNVSLVSLRLGRHGAATARLQMGAVPREPERP